MDPNMFPPIPQGVFYALYAWSLIWKGVALWKAAQQHQRNWFVVILIINTLGILEIVYLFFFSKKKMTISDLQFWKLFMQDSSSKKK